MGPGLRLSAPSDEDHLIDSGLGVMASFVHKTAESGQDDGEFPVADVEPVCFQFNDVAKNLRGDVAMNFVATKVCDGTINGLKLRTPFQTPMPIGKIPFVGFSLEWPSMGQRVGRRERTRSLVRLRGRLHPSRTS